MESRRSSLPNIREQAYELAYKLAREQLARMDVEEICCKTGAQPIDSSKIIVEYLNQRYLVILPDGEISLCDDQKEVLLKDKILILHYLTSAQGTPLTNKLITFRQLPGCTSRFPLFSQLTVTPLLNHFGKEPELLMASAAKLGGHKAGYGDVSVTINAFPRVPIILILWRGDDEFPPRGSIIFDSSISDYLSADDIMYLCATIVWKLIKNLPYFSQ